MQADAGQEAYFVEVASDRPFAFYRFNDPIGDVQSFIGQLPLSPANNPERRVDGVLGPGVRFDGAAGQRFESSAPLFDFAPKKAFSIELWFFPTSAPDDVYRHLVAKDNDGGNRHAYGIFFRTAADGPGRGLVFERIVNGENVQIAAPEGEVTLEVWHHIVATYDGAQLALYLDNRLIGTQPDARPFEVQTRPLFIGAKNEGEGAIKGLLDELAFYDHVLTTARVSAHYEALRKAR